MTVAEFDHLVYVRVFEGCNLHCQHCFIPANPKRLQHADIARLPDALASRIPQGQRVLVQWHGGEPTLLGVDWLRDAIAILSADSRYDWRHGIQTNLLQYDAAWGVLFKERFGGEIGVSWDPGIRWTARNDPTSHAKFEALFWPRVAAALADGLEISLVVTGTRLFFETYPSPLDFFAMLTARGIRRVHIERITKTGAARQNWESLGLDNRQWSHHMGRFARAYLQWRRQASADNVPPLFISPLDGLFTSVGKLSQDDAQGYGCLSGQCDTRFHTYDAQGYKAGCTALTAEVDNPRQQVAPIVFHAPAETRAKRTASCEGCRYRKICSSGCLATPKMDHSGECSGGFQLFSVVDQLQPLWRKENLHE